MLRCLTQYLGVQGTTIHRRNDHADPMTKAKGNLWKAERGSPSVALVATHGVCSAVAVLRWVRLRRSSVPPSQHSAQQASNRHELHSSQATLGRAWEGRNLSSAIRKFQTKRCEHALPNGRGWKSKA